MKRKTIIGIAAGIFSCLSLAVHAQYVTKVFDFLPAPGQFTNTAIATSDAADNVIGYSNKMVSLGSFGGYIVVGFDRPVVNDPQNPYGVDFSIEGNSFAGNAYGQWCEPGAVQVMKDLNGDGIPNDGEWYELAGSDYYLSTTQRNVTVTYYNPHYSIGYVVPWSANDGTRGAMVVNRFHGQPYYPNPFDFGTDILDSVSFTGNKIRGTVNMSSPSYLNPHRAPAFGYCDSKGINQPLTRPQNPYTAGTDGFDLSWAIDSEGNHVDLDVVHFVRIYNAGFANIGWLGEWSTEVLNIAITTPDPDYVPQDCYLHYIGLTQLHVLKGHSCKYDGLLFKNGRPIDEGSPRWWTSDPTIATVDNEGLLTAHELGKIWLYFSQNDDVPTDSVPIQVVELQRVVLEIEGNSNISSDSTALYVNEKIYIIGECEDNRTEVLNATVANRFVYEPFIWSSSNPEAGTIDNGLFTGIAPGRTMVYARSASQPDLQDSILVIVKPIPEVQPVREFIQIPTFAPQGNYKPSELFTTGSDAEIILLSVAAQNGKSSARLENNRFHYRFEPGEFSADTVRFTLKVFGEEREFDLTFAYAAAVRSVEKQILFTHCDADGVQSVKSWAPASDETLTIAAKLPEAATDMRLDGAFLFVAAGNSLFRYNVSTAKLENSRTLDYAPCKLLVAGNRIFVAGRQDDAARLFVYYKTDFTPAATIDLPAELAAMTVRGDTVYAVLNGADYSAMAIVSLGLNTVELEKVIDWGIDAINVSDLTAKDDKLFAVSRKAGSVSAAVIAFHTGDETRTVIPIDNVDIQFPNTSAIIEPMNGDTLLLKSSRGFRKFDTAALTLKDGGFMNDRDRYSAGTVYDPEERKYYVAHNTSATAGSQGSVYSDDYVSERKFAGLGTDPAILLLAPALSDNDRPEIKATLSDERIVERMPSPVITISKANSFADQEDNFRIYPKTAAPFLSWERTGENLRYSAFFDGRVSEDSVVTVEIEAIDHYGCATVSPFTLTIVPRIYTPRISTPLLNQTVDVDAPDRELSLSQTFEFFTANVAATNLKSLHANSNPDLVTASVDAENDVLRLSFTPAKTGQAIITVRGTTVESSPDDPQQPESKFIDAVITVTVGSGTTAITPPVGSEVKTNNYLPLSGKEEIYDLSGRRVSAANAKRGVYLLKQGTKTIKIVVSD
jgi:hypothetical protein